MYQKFDHIVDGQSAVVGSTAGIASIIIYGIVNETKLEGELNASVFFKSLQATFYDSYDWPPFLIALLVPLLFTLFAACMGSSYYRYTGKSRPNAIHLGKSRPAVPLMRDDDQTECITT